MKLNNILAIIANDYRIVRKVKWRILEVTYFPLSTVLIWGLFSLYSRAYAVEAGLIVLIVNLFWSFSQLAQQEANILIMEDLWTSSLRNTLTSGVSQTEYILAKLFMSSLTAVVVASVLMVIANAFGAPLSARLGTVVLLAGISLLCSIGLAVIIAGTVVMLGREYGFLSWSTMQLLVFLSAPFYSPAILPAAARWITEIMPFTYVFQAARAIATGAPIPNGMLVHAFVIAMIYVVAAWPYYFWAFRRAKKTGMLARIAG